jgi:hypothetical protein
MYKQIIDAETGAASGRVILRTADSVFIPFANGNTDYAAYLAWLAEGNAPEPPGGADEPESPGGDESGEHPE